MICRRLCLLLLLLTGLSTTAQTTPRPAPAFPADIRVERNVAFLAPDRKPRADLYLPRHLATGEQRPAMVIIHGGGWTTGHRDERREINIGSTLVRNGYVAMSIDYILADHKQTVWPTNLWDCKTAVRWLRQNATRLGVDPARIGVIGGSAGGHLAAMVTLTTPADGLDPASPYGDVSCAVKCGIDLYGIADIGTYHDAPMLGKSFAEAPELYRLASPNTYVRSNSPPLLILHGDADTTVNVQQSKTFAAALERVGAPHQLLIIPGAVHTFDLQPPQMDLRPTVLKFLEANLKN